jgi:CBS domain-containing protein
MMRVDELMTSPVHTVRADLSPKQASQFLVEHRVGCAPVVEPTGELIGIVTEADLMRLELHRDPTRHQRREPVEHAAPPPARIAEMMTSEVLAVPVDFDVADAARLMIERHITRIPVVEGEQVVGILSRTDLLRLLVHGHGDRQGGGSAAHRRTRSLDRAHRSWPRHSHRCRPP